MHIQFFAVLYECKQWPIRLNREHTLLLTFATSARGGRGKKQRTEKRKSIKSKQAANRLSASELVRFIYE